jgi:UDP-glucuronate 4-epimerase
MKILVTGIAGFIGYHLAKKLLDQGHTVIGLDNINDYYDVNLKYARLSELGISKDNLDDGKLVHSSTYPKHSFIKANLEDAETLNNLFETQNFDAVCNLAAQAGVRYSIENPHAYISSNVVGFMNILEACRNYNVKNLSYASSSSVYGLNKSQPFKTTDMTDTPVSLYAATKKSNELMAHTYSHLYSIQTTGLRFFTVYGPWGRPDMAPMLFTDAILNDRAIKVFNNGEMSRDFTYIDDIVDGIIKVIDNPSDFNVYNIGNNSPLPLMTFIETIEKALNKKATKNFMPMQDGDVVSTYADVSGLINDFGYKPNTKLADGIDEFVKWYKEFYGDNK